MRVIEKFAIEVVTKMAPYGAYVETGSDYPTKEVIARVITENNAVCASVKKIYLVEKDNRR